MRVDLMHEFLGDIDMTFRELNSSLKVSDDNDNTCGSVGIGVSLMSNENSSLFFEADTIFSGDYEESYSISMGGRYLF